MIFKKLFYIYLAGLLIAIVIPYNGYHRIMDHTTVINLRLDYLAHGLMFSPMLVLWRLGFPGHPLWLILVAGMLLGAGLEGIHYILPYRVYNINDLLANVAGVLLGGLLVGIMDFIKTKHHE